MPAISKAVSANPIRNGNVLCGVNQDGTTYTHDTADSTGSDLSSQDAVISDRMDGRKYYNEAS